MSESHSTLRPYVDSPSELYAVLKDHQKSDGFKLALTGWALLASLAGVLWGSGNVAKGCTILAVTFALNYVAIQLDRAHRNWFMHALTLRDLLSPRDTHDS